jgi:hypothetical protein
MYNKGMCMEFLKFNSLGQWSLLEKNKDNGYPSDLDNLSHRPLHLQGSLPKDIGTQGALHNNPNMRRPKYTSKNKMKGKVPTPTRSEFADRHPGLQAI